MIRALVVDDSLTVRRRLVDILASAHDIEVVGEAGDGRRAVELTRLLRPDVVTLDLALPDMNGLAATEQIMAHVPTPILIVSASFNRGEMFDTYSALAAGAVDVLEKPAVDDASWDERFIAAVRMVSRIKVITHLRGRSDDRERAARVIYDRRTPPPDGSIAEIVAIGASTGGPGALVQVVGGITSSLPAVVVVVLHIEAAFAGSFADWLGSQIGRAARIAQDGEPVRGEPGRVVVAPSSHHLIVDRGVLRLTLGPPRHHCRPSIDELFESIARGYHEHSAAALLTGMGRDGATGLLAIRQAGGFTVAQDEATSVVYGMPREAALCGGAERVLPLHEIGPALELRARAKERRR